jgi:hypothetical protein
MVQKAVNNALLGDEDAEDGTSLSKTTSAPAERMIPVIRN